MLNDAHGELLPVKRIFGIIRGGRNQNHLVGILIAETKMAKCFDLSTLLLIKLGAGALSYLHICYRATRKLGLDASQRSQAGSSIYTLIFTDSQRREWLRGPTPAVNLGKQVEAHFPDDGDGCYHFQDGSSELAWPT